MMRPVDPEAQPPETPVSDDGADVNMWGRARARRRRFLDRYEERYIREERGEVRSYERPVRVTVGVVMILLGIAIGWLPGPGFIILAFPGALLVASEWRRAAIALDRVENEAIPRMRLLHARLRGGPKPEWVQEDPLLWGIEADRRAGRSSDTGKRRRRTDHGRPGGGGDRRQPGTGPDSGDDTRP